MEEENVKRLDKVELKLLEQEHRLIPAFLNLIKGWDSKKERFASFKALLFVFFSSGTVTAIGVSVTALLGLVIAYKANEILSLQNDLILQQTYLAESTRRSSLNFELSSILDEIDEELDYLDENLRTSEHGNFQSVRVAINLSPRLQGRIIALSNSLKPYKYLDEKGVLTRPLSPERGQLLISLINSNVNINYVLSKANFMYADLEGNSFVTNNFSNAKLSWANLNKVNFHGAILISTDFSKAELRNANFAFSKLNGANFKGAIINGANFEGAYLPRAEMFTEAFMDSIKLPMFTVLEENWLDTFFNLPNVPKNLNKSDYLISKDTASNTNFTAFRSTTVDKTGKITYDSFAGERVVYRIKNTNITTINSSNPKNVQSNSQ